MKKILEVCCGSFADVERAVEGGAERIELCSALSLDGLTPSMGLIESVKTYYPQLTIHVLIRPREGDFVYTDEEKKIIMRDIRNAIISGADAIVCGALTRDGDIDVEAVQNMLGMVRCGGGKSLTFHRAFDVCRDPIHALSVLKELGVTRILTSGQQSTAEKGIPLLKQLVEEAGDQLIILPGGGVNSGNAREILQQTGAKEIHGSCRKGTTSTDAAEVAAVIREINR